MKTFNTPLAAYRALDDRGFKDIWFHAFTRVVAFGDREDLPGDADAWREISTSQLAGFADTDIRILGLRLDAPMRAKVEQEDVAGLSLFQTELKV